MTVGAAWQVVHPQSSIANLQFAAARTHRKRRDVCATRVPHVALRFSGAGSAVRQATDCGFYFSETLRLFIPQDQEPRSYMPTARYPRWPK